MIRHPLFFDAEARRRGEERFCVFSASLRLRVNFVLAALLLCSCSRPTVAPTAAAPPTEERLPDGTVVIPAGSPKLAEIHTDIVRTASVPFDEVVSPGKIEANPNLMSRVALPLTGRVSSVLVKLGDSVKRGDPLLTFEAPD